MAQIATNHNYCILLTECHSLQLLIASLSTCRDYRYQQMNMGFPLPGLATYLNADPSPSFIIPTDLENPINFEISFSNHVFQQDKRLTALFTNDEKPCQPFMAWCLTVSHWLERYDFAGYSWTVFKINHNFKAIRASPQLIPVATKPIVNQETAAIDFLEDKVDEASLAVQKPQNLQRLMDISQMGSYEYGPTGNLIRANVRDAKRPAS